MRQAEYERACDRFSDTLDSGSTVASYTYTNDRAGQRLSEASTITTGPTNGTATSATTSSFVS